jgi:hypothetical protein
MPAPMGLRGYPTDGNGSPNLRSYTFFAAFDIGVDLGQCVVTPATGQNRRSAMPQTQELAAGRHFLASLHTKMQKTLYPEMKFHALFDWTNDCIKTSGFENLDFLGNVGCSIAAPREDRQYIEVHNMRLLQEAHFYF